MAKLTNVDTNYVETVAKRHQNIGWFLGILYANTCPNEEEILTQSEAAEMIHKVHELVVGEKIPTTQWINLKGQVTTSDEEM
jgi:hypothetical protein|tara:strand:- start:151 stop:396 length:246 start_codon:yes stop_codon:yes gene_type:complete